MITYTAHAALGTHYWVVRVPGLGNNPDQGLPTQARRLADVEATARDLVATYLDVDPETVAITVAIDLPASIRSDLDTAARLADDARRLSDDAADRRRAAARELRSRGLTVREIGTVLGVSFQRAQQLLAA